MAPAHRNRSNDAALTTDVTLGCARTGETAKAKIATVPATRLREIIAFVLPGFSISNPHWRTQSAYRHGFGQDSLGFRVYSVDMIRPALFLHQELLLMALRDEKGTIDNWNTGRYNYAVGGAILVELLLAEAVRIAAGRKPLVLLELPHGWPACCVEFLLTTRRICSWSA